MRMSTSAALLALSLAVPSALAADASLFRGGPARNGVYDAAGAPAFHRVKWRFHTGGPIYSSPAIVDGTVFFGSNDHFLYAVDAASGALKWKFETRSRIPSSPAVADGTVFALSYDGNLYAVDAGSGALKWKFATAGERRFAARRLHGGDPTGETMPDPFDFYLSSPVVWNGTVYFGGGDSFVYALDASNGLQKWKIRTGDVVHASPTLADGVLYIGSWDSYFYAFDAATGRYLWHFATGNDPIIHNQVGIQSTAAVAGGLVFFGCRDSNLYALDAKTGEKKWAYDNKGSWVIGSPAVKDGVVYYSTSDSGMFRALDATTGAEIFSLSTNRWPMFSSPAIAGKTLYIGTHEGKLLAVDLARRAVAWTYQTDASRSIGPTYTKADGTPNYEAAFPDFFYDNMVIGVSRMLSVGAILSSPVVAGEVVYVGSADGDLYAIE